MKKIIFSTILFSLGVFVFGQNPIMLKDTYPGPTGSGIQQIVKTTNYTFFNAEDDDADLDRGLYRTDGTEAGTMKLNLVYPTYISTKAEKLTALGDKVIFAGDNSTTYGEIWASNGTQAGTIALERFQPTAGRFAVMDMTKMGSVVMYGVAANNNHTLLKKTDGTIAGTSVVYDFSSFTTTPELGLFQTINGILYFNLYDIRGTGVDQLWRSDGTNAGTYMLKDFGIDHYVASGYMPAGSLFYVMTVKPGFGNELWKSDGTDLGTLPVKIISTSGNNNYPQYVAINSFLLFAGLDAGGGKELWITDGTDLGTHQVADINPGNESSNPSNLTVLNDNIYFSATTSGVTGTISAVNKLLKFDGSTVSTIKDITCPSSGNGLSLFAVSNNTIFFRGITAASGAELWITDGTTANTLQVSDINPGINSSNPNILTPGNPVYFAANNGVSGFEVFKYDNLDGINIRNVWLTGTAFGEWKESGVIKLTNNGGGIYTATNIQIIGDGRFKFTEGTWASAAGFSGTTAAPGFPSGVSEVPGTDDITGVPGFYNVTYNYVTKAYSFTPTPPNNWGVVGTATPNGWGGPDMPLTYDATTNKWSGVVSLSTGEIKFRNNNDWALNYGGIGTDGPLVSNGPNIAITAGRYLITLDFNTLNYSIKSALVAIPDPSFEQALINLGIDKDGVVNASIFRSDAEAVTELNVIGKNINSLQGIQAFINLSKLFCQNNLIQVLDISNNKALTVLECGGNQLNQLNVTQNPLLRVLGFGPNNISGIDVSQNLNLEVFWCNNNNITSQNLDLNSKLSVIGLSNNPLAFVSLKNGNNVNVVYFEAYNTPNLACINADAVVSVSMSNSGKTFSENCSTTSLAGSWIIAPETRALKVGPTLGSDQWWYLNKFGDDIAARACYLDDKYVFNENGSFNNVLGSETYLETWQGVASDQCGVPVAPHNGSTNATYAYDQNAGTITLIGQGAYLGLPKVANGYELPNGPVPNSITYNVSFSDNGNIMTLSINFGAGFWTYKLIKESGIKKYYVNDNSKSGDVFTSAIGNDYNIGTKAAPFATINYAMSKAQNGDTIFVDAGTYAERIIVTKSLSFKGASAGINPGTSLNRGLSESILLPSLDNNILEIITVQAADVTIDGFLFDGDNPALAGSVSLNGIDVNAGMGIFNGNLQTNNLSIKNNIFKNFLRYGMLLQKTTTALSGISISRNHFDNISSRTPRDGRAIGLFNNAYATVTENYLTRVNTGIVMANFNLASADSVIIESNTIEAYSYGILANGNANLASPMVINNNNLTVSNLATWSAPGSSTVNSCTGLGLFTFTSSKNLSITNNTITGTQNGIYTDRIFASDGFQINGGSISNSTQIGLFHNNRGVGASKLTVSNLSLLNNVVGIDASSADANTMQLEFSGVTIDGGTTGIRFYGAPISLPSNTLSGISFSNQTKEYILQTVNAFQGQTIDVSTIVFDGITPTNMTLAQLFATEDKLTHKIDFDNVGYFKLLPNNVYVTPNSFAATLPPVFGTPTTTPDINRAVGCANAGDTVYIAAGAYTNQVTLDKGLTLIGAGSALTSILKPATTVAPPGPFTEQGVIQTAQNIGDVHISDLSITADYTTNVTPIILQSGGSVKNCLLQNGNQGIFVRVDPATNPTVKSVLIENNTISAEYISVNFAGTNLTASLLNNDLSQTNTGWSVGVFAGMDFGSLPQFAANGNKFNNYVANGIQVNATNAIITQNSFIGSGFLAIQKSGGNNIAATCNWYGTSSAQAVASKISGAVTYSPWLSSGTDTDLVLNGFQPLPNVCNGTSVTVTFDSSTNVTCKGINNGTVNITVSNGLAPYNFLWSNNDNLEFSASTEDLTNLEPGTYQLLLTDENGSTVSLSDIVISEPNLLTATSSGTDNLCFGNAIGTASVIADGGTPPYTYLWSNGGTSDEISNLSVGLYTITVIDANGCTATSSYEVTQPALLTVTIANNSTACSNIAMLTAGGGTPGYTYLWSNGATSDSISSVPIGAYSVTVTDANGCTAIASITLSVGEAFNPSVSVTNASCFGNNNGAITVTNANGTAPFSFSIDGVNFTPGVFPYNFNNLNAGNYTVAVRDVNGCTGFVTKTITQPPLLEVTLNTVQSTCAGQTTGSISITTSGGSGALGYNWTGPNGYISSQKNPSNLATGNYVLLVTDNNGCTASLNVVVPTFNSITVSGVVTNVLCKGDVNGAINISATGGTGTGFSYSWTGAIISLNEDLSNLAKGNYNLKITDNGSGCFISTSYTVTEPVSNLAFSTTKTNATGCSGSLGTITVTASGGTSPYAYNLNGGSYGNTNSFTGLYAGNYTVGVKDVNGCLKTAVVSITDNGSDAYESNNSKNQAKLISIAGQVNARIALATDIADWFKFTTVSAGNYVLNMSHPSVNYTFNLYATGNNTPALVPVITSSTLKQYNNLAANTTYYVQITGGLSYNCYSLLVTSAAPSSVVRKAAVEIVAEKKIEISILKATAYPNPHRGSFNLKIETPILEKAKIELFTASGQLLAERTINLEIGANNIVSFTDMFQGMIFYRIQIGDQFLNGKIIGTIK